MPWSHCDDDAIPDDAPCAACGLTKAEWTVQLDATRTFAVAAKGRGKRKRDAWIEVQLVGPGGAPMAGAAYRIALPDSRVKQGELDEEGKVRLEKLRAGTCEVSFPGAIDEAAERETGERHVFELALPPFVPSL